MLDAAGEIVEESRIATTPKALRARFEGLASTRIAHEVGTHSTLLEDETRYRCLPGDDSRYMSRRETKPGQRWKTFLDNHVRDLSSIDFFTIPTATFRVLFVFLVLSHDRRRVIHFNVTANPTSAWTGQQILGAFP